MPVDDGFRSQRSALMNGGPAASGQQVRAYLLENPEVSGNTGEIFAVSLTPFFFIGIGLALEGGAFASALGIGAALTAVAVIAKVVGAGIPALLTTSAAGATLIGISMVPRAEITMIIMERGQQLGDWAVPANLYAAFVIVSALTCLLAPVTLEILFRRWPSDVKSD